MRGKHKESCGKAFYFAPKNEPEPAPRSPSLASVGSGSMISGASAAGTVRGDLLPIVPRMVTAGSAPVWLDGTNVATEEHIHDI